MPASWKDESSVMFQIAQKLNTIFINSSTSVIFSKLLNKKKLIYHESWFKIRWIFCWDSGRSKIRWIKIRLKIICKDWRYFNKVKIVGDPSFENNVKDLKHLVNAKEFN